MTRSMQAKSGMFSYLLLLTGIFVLLEISFAIQGSGLYLGDFSYIADHLQIPLAVLPAILFYLGAELLVHVAFTTLVWLMARGIGSALQCSWQQTQTIGFGLWCGSLLTVLIANQQFYPNSKFADLTRIIFPAAYTEIIFLFFVGIFSLALFTAALGGFAACVRRLPALTLLLTTLLGATAFTLHQPHFTTSDAATAAKPNIILIGVDALRPDVLAYFGHTEITPQLDGFLKHATVFGEAVTPLARTFPAWVSILTGTYPKHNNARFDLIDQTGMDYSATLPMLLKKAGYETIYAMDETRFSNIGKNMGFDAIVTPATGFNDFLLGTFNDFPLSNLVVNTAVGKWLFPYSYGNRAAFITYDPDSFLNLLKQVLAGQHSRPVMLAVHFCLPHFPYLWGAYSHLQSTDAYVQYQMAVQRADTQVGDFLTQAANAGLLTHSIVVLLSDHGEALELAGDRITEQADFLPGKNNPQGIFPHFYPASFATEAVNESAGHGTDVLGLSQYHSVLAIRQYGAGKQKETLVPGVVSLMDIKPTLLAILGLPASGDGKSLLAYLSGLKTQATNQEDHFIESDFSPEAVHSVHPEMRAVVLEGLDFFQVNPQSLQLTVKPAMGKVIISAKQFADIRGNWMLAVYPQHLGILMPILVNLQTGKWTNDLRIPFAQHSPAKQMLTALQHFYGTDLGTIENI